MVIPLAGGTKENMVKITTTRKEINGRKPRYFRFEFMQEVNVNVPDYAHAARESGQFNYQVKNFAQVNLSKIRDSL